MNNEIPFLDFLLLIHVANFSIGFSRFTQSIDERRGRIDIEYYISMYFLIFSFFLLLLYIIK